ncbi:MAG: DNA polymerase II large subunit, partial [Methanobrevibacter sp.]|nr:DNA polymerase II large subunit [Methanobrevibacter sp.]
MDYFERLEKETINLYKIAEEARSKGFDAELHTETPLAKDLAERVEGLVGPKGIAKRIKELEVDEDGNKTQREKVAFRIAAEIASQSPDYISDDLKIEFNEDKSDINIKEFLAQKGLRAALAILTEGVVAAPLEGIAGVKIKDNSDGTKYLAVYFAGPIRSAGGTAAALAVLLGDKIKEATGLSNYKPTEEEIERYVEEVELYESEVTNLQYSPKPEEVRLAAQNIPVEVTGEPTEKVEVSHRDLPRVETNSIRGGALLAMVEGVIQKSAKISKYTKTLDLDGWQWLEGYSKDKDKEKSEEENSKVSKNKETGESDFNVDEVEVIKEQPKYIQDIIGGRPVLGHPSENGAFRLRYGRSRNTGLAAMGVHPATMELLQFLAIGTQLKIEYPGKGNCVVPVDSIEGPIVKLRNGDTIQLTSRKEAIKYRNQVIEIIFLGDMLVAYGEFLRNNQKLLPASWTEEWWIETILKSEVYQEEEKNDSNNKIDINDLINKLIKNEISAKESFEISKKYKVPLNPKYTYFFGDISIDDLNILIKWVLKNKGKYTEDNEFILEMSPEKRIFEILGVEHKVEDNKIIINNDNGYTIINLFKKELPNEKFKFTDTIEAINSISDVKIMNKAPSYIGSRVGRPEKSKERLMKPAPHVLFPIDTQGGTRRFIDEAAKQREVRVEFSRKKCPECLTKTNNSLCPKCGTETLPGNPSKKNIGLTRKLLKAKENVDIRKSDEVKGVKGMISESKLPEPLEKGLLRAKNDVHTFKDGTIRHDSTNLPLTHFIPSEIGVTVEKLKKMGYEKDCYGKDIENENQIVELRVQDVVVSKDCGEFLVRVSNFIDDLFERFYKMNKFYNVKTKEDLIGHLIVGLAPHTSAGVLGRIVGYTDAHACYAHPYFHSAKRRNCDSDEDSVMLLLDSLTNFSKSYLPSTRGGSMDAPLVLSSRIDPEEIDDESHNIDIMPKLPLEFFEKTYEELKPGEVLDYIDNISKHLGSEKQYKDLMFSHHTSSIHAGPNTCLYLTLGSMKDKVDEQVRIGELIRAVDQRDVVEGVLSSHFLPDIMGNVRTFSKQKVRCTKCNEKYRRVPLSGKCKCGGNLTLTVSKGGVSKYLPIAEDLVSKYPIDPYLVQRLEIQKFGIGSLFESDKSKQ